MAQADPGIFGVVNSEQITLLEQAAYCLDARLMQENRQPEDWNVSFLLAVHRELFGHVFPERAGVVRLTEVSLRDLPIARPGQIIHRLADLVQMAKEAIGKARLIADPEEMTQQVIRRVARFHAASVVAQPFIDGNKRWARLILNALLADCGFELGTRIDDGRHAAYMRAIDHTIAGNPDILAEMILLGWIEQRDLYRKSDDSGST
jgi:fido (protein-threonine AMPylation protein)